MEDGVLVVERNTLSANTLLTSTQTSEVFSSLRNNIRVKLNLTKKNENYLENNSTSGLTTNSNIEENLRTRHFNE